MDDAGSGRRCSGKSEIETVAISPPPPPLIANRAGNEEGKTRVGGCPAPKREYSILGHRMRISISPTYEIRTHFHHVSLPLSLLCFFFLFVASSFPAAVLMGWGDDRGALI